MKLCSACLLGLKCRHNGKNKENKKVIALSKTETLIPVCPDQLGGFPTPRPAAEISGGDGRDVLKWEAKVVDSSGNNVTVYCVLGAEEVLKIAKMYGIKEAILKQRCPSCGCGEIYDGTFHGKIIKGDGVTAALLKRHKIKVISDEDL